MPTNKNVLTYGELVNMPLWGFLVWNHNLNKTDKAYYLKMFEILQF